jgi:hypothetical protein
LLCQVSPHLYTKSTYNSSMSSYILVIPICFLTDSSDIQSLYAVPATDLMNVMCGASSLSSSFVLISTGIGNRSITLAVILQSSSTATCVYKISSHNFIYLLIVICFIFQIFFSSVNCVAQIFGNSPIICSITLIVYYNLKFW